MVVDYRSYPQCRIQWCHLWEQAPAIAVGGLDVYMSKDVIINSDGRADTMIYFQLLGGSYR